MKIRTPRTSTRCCGSDRAGGLLGPDCTAFTMIEIAVSLAVIGFALAAIIGVLPIGLNVQRDNREETVINQDANVLLNAIRYGELGLDDLTNYVVAITNYQTEYAGAGKPIPRIYGYTQTGSSVSPPLLITNGFRIIGLLSTPKYTDTVSFSNGRLAFRSNYIVAYVRSLSGDASEKFPQTNKEVQAFGYRLISEIVPYAGFDRNWTNYSDPAIVGNTNEITTRSNFMMIAKTMQTNLYDMRLIFRYPALPNGKVLNGRQVYRTSVSGALFSTNEFGFPRTAPYELYFFQPRTYVTAK